MHERDTFLKTWEWEHNTTVKVLNAYPADKLDVRPAPKCKTAGELAWMFVRELDQLMAGAAQGKVEFGPGPERPTTVPALVSALNNAYASARAKVMAMTDAEWNGDMDWYVAPKTPGKMRRADVLWMALHDQIHHRGQFSIYLRIADGKLPSIYGPTADEPWM